MILAITIILCILIGLVTSDIRKEMGTFVWLNWIIGFGLLFNIIFW